MGASDDWEGRLAFAAAALERQEEAGKKSQNPVMQTFYLPPSWVYNVEKIAIICHTIQFVGMSNKKSRKGGGKKNQAGGREHDAMAMTDKTLNSYDSDAHLSMENKLQKDSLRQQREHMDNVRARKGRPRKFRGDEPAEDTKPVDLKDEEDDRKILLVDDERLIVGRRLYDRQPDGTPAGKNAASDEFMARHGELRRERCRHLDRDGTHVEVGKVIRERKGRDVETPKMLGGERDKNRRASAVIKSIMARLMPHEARIAAGELSGEALDAAMDFVVTGFQAATGCEIISAVAHRMTDHDLHIHIQYTMVVAQEKQVGEHSKIKKAWDKVASDMAREALRAVNVHNPNSSAIGAMTKKLKKAGKITQPPTVKVVYRKIKGRRFMGKGSILGYSLRHKLNLTRLAQEAGDNALGKRVIDMKDQPGRFAPIAARTDQDLEEKYLDVWLERTWRKTVKECMSQEFLEKMKSAGVQAAKDYADYGTSMPEAFDLEGRKKQLDKMEYDLFLEQKYQDYANDCYREELDTNYDKRAEDLQEQHDARLQELEERGEKQDEREAKLVSREVRITETEKSLITREGNLKNEEAAVAALRLKSESLEKEVDQLKAKARLADKLINFWKEILDTPGFGKMLQDRYNKIWSGLKALGAEMGLAIKIEVIEKTGNYKLKKSDDKNPGMKKPGE